MTTAGPQLGAACARAQLAELHWLDADGCPDVTVVTPLVLDGAPALALTYARSSLARSLAAAPQVVLTLATPALLRGATPLAVAGRLTLEEDPDGQRFRTQLLDQELAKHPPARRLADSLLLQREHWWYLPRVLLRLRPAGAPRELVAAPGAVAAVADGGGLVVEACDVDDHGERAALRRCALPDGPAAVLEHGGEVPELEHRWHRRLRGPLRDGVLSVDERDEVPPATRRPGLLTRWRAQRDLERACREGLRRAGHHGR